jgi:hypothetical protein
VKRENVAASGIVHTPVVPHSCSPGWTWTPIPDDMLVPGAKGGGYGTPPARWNFPKGTVWKCDCGRTWVALGRCRCWQVHFRPEGRFARWRRERSPSSEVSK